MLLLLGLGGRRALVAAAAVVAGAAAAARDQGGEAEPRQGRRSVRHGSSARRLAARSPSPRAGATAPLACPPDAARATARATGRALLPQRRDLAHRSGLGARWLARAHESPQLAAVRRRAWRANAAGEPRRERVGADAASASAARRRLPARGGERRRELLGVALRLLVRVGEHAVRVDGDELLADGGEGGAAVAGGGRGEPVDLRQLLRPRPVVEDAVGVGVGLQQQVGVEAGLALEAVRSPAARACRAACGSRCA